MFSRLLRYLFASATCAQAASIGADVTSIKLPPPGKNSAEAVVKGIERARQIFASRPSASAELVFGGGEYDLDRPTKGREGIIELNGLHPGKDGRLSFRGAGPDKTTLFSPRGPIGYQARTPNVSRSPDYI